MQPQPRHTFAKKERLTGKILIEKLFKEPQGSLFAYPIKFTWRFAPNNEDTPAQVLITVSKKNFKRAHDRNRIKRQLREIYRKNKHLLYDFLTSKEQKACFLIAYVGKEHIDTAHLENRVKNLFDKFIHATAEQNT